VWRWSFGASDWLTPFLLRIYFHIIVLGVLACLDGYLNMALEQSEEYGVDGLLKAKYGDCFIRGNNGKPPTCLMIALAWLDSTRLGSYDYCRFVFVDLVACCNACPRPSALCFHAKATIVAAEYGTGKVTRKNGLSTKCPRLGRNGLKIPCCRRQLGP
jgi:LSM domain